MSIYQELESLRLSRYAIALPCFICGEGNNCDAELCRHCRAPLALTVQAIMRRMRPKLLSVIGPPGCGKTVYLGMLLDMLSRQGDELQLLPRGAFSVSLQQMVVGHLARCTFPPPTPDDPGSWNWLHAEVQPRGAAGLELIMPDVSGQSLYKEIDHPNSCPVVRSFLGKSDAALMVIDAAQLDEGDSEPDYQAMKALSFLCESHGRKPQRRLAVAMAVLFTKADRCEGALADPRRFAQTHTPGFWQLCQERLSHVECFAASVVGACSFSFTRAGKELTPLRIEPRGVIEPLRWLVGKLTPRRKWFRRK